MPFYLQADQMVPNDVWVNMTQDTKTKTESMSTGQGLSRSKLKSAYSLNYMCNEEASKTRK